MKNGFESCFVPFESVRYTRKGSALIFAPHPDDEVIGCGGAIIRHVRNNDPVKVVIVTDGSLGDPDLALQAGLYAEHGQNEEYNNAAGGISKGFDHAADYRQAVADYIDARKEESRKAGQILGYGVPDFLGIGDRTLEYGEDRVNLVMEKIDAFSPSVVYAPSLYEMHPDHRALAMIVLEAVRRCRSHPDLIMYEVGRPIPSPDMLLDITDIVSIKLDAIKCFKTQLKINPFDEYAFSLNRFRAYTLPCDVKNAEAYLKLKMTGKNRSVVDLFFSESEFQRKLGLYSDIRSIPLVSIVIRTIGRDFLLKKALDSIALQTYPDIEIVIIDAVGNFEIGTSNLSGRFNVRVFSEHRPLSRGVAANAGLDNARGDYILFLDDDDWIEGNHIARLVAAAEDHSGFQVFYSGTRCVYDNGEDTDFLFNYQYDNIRLYTENYLPIHSVMFKRDFVMEKGCRFDEQLDIYEDWDFWLQLSMYTDFFHVDNISAVYRITHIDGSGVHEPANIEKGKRIIFRKWRNIIPENRFCALMEYARAHGELVELRKQKDSIEKICSGLRVEIGKCNQKINQYDEAMNHNKNMIVRLHEQQKEKEQQIAELSQIVEKIHNSMAFRFYKWLSAPLRILRKWKAGK